MSIKRRLKLTNFGNVKVLCWKHLLELSDSDSESANDSGKISFFSVKSSVKRGDDKTM